MIDPPDHVAQAFTFHGVSYPHVIQAALCIWDIETGGKGRGLEPNNFQRSRRPGTDWLDFSVDLLKFMPERPQERRRVECYATGSHLGCRVVRRFILAVPDDIWIEGAKIAARV